VRAKSILMTPPSFSSVGPSRAHAVRNTPITLNPYRPPFPHRQAQGRNWRFVAPLFPLSPLPDTTRSGGSISSKDHLASSSPARTFECMSESPSWKECAFPSIAERADCTSVFARRMGRVLIVQLVVTFPNTGGYRLLCLFFSLWLLLGKGAGFLFPLGYRVIPPFPFPLHGRAL